MKTIKFLAIALVAGVALHSCKDDEEPVDRMQNQEFVTMASSSNMFEIRAGELAEEKGMDADVVEYGHHMVMDHGAAGTELAALAAVKGWRIPDEMLEKERNNLNLLMPLSGNAFDREFARLMVVSHEEAVALFERASGHLGVPDAQLREWAQGKLPTLRAHLDEARALNARVNP